MRTRRSYARPPPAGSQADLTARAASDVASPAVPSTVASLFAAAGLAPAGPVRWGELVDEKRPGVYVVALTARIDEVAGTVERPKFSDARLQELLDRRPVLRLDKTRRPTAPELGERLAGFWLPDETVLYAGCTTRPLRTRTREYYGHRVGCKSPHKGGWPLKVLAFLDALWVHWAPAVDPDAAERDMLDAFAAAVSAATESKLLVAESLMPYANLQDGHRRRKRHGISRATGPCRAS